MQVVCLSGSHQDQLLRGFVVPNRTGWSWGVRRLSKLRLTPLGLTAGPPKGGQILWGKLRLTPSKGGHMPQRRQPSAVAFERRDFLRAAVLG